MNNEIKVWDIAVRVFHWSLVLFFLLAYISSEFEGIVHIYAGYGVLALICFRLVWGFIGSKHARFSDFLVTPSEIIRYAKSMLSFSPKHYLGHNPLGGLMIVALLTTLLVVSVSGLKLYAVEEGLGPLANIDSVSLISAAYADNDDGDDASHQYNEDDEEFWEELHEGATDFMILLILLHITGVLVSSVLEKENLAKAMISGKKIIRKETE